MSDATNDNVNTNESILLSIKKLLGITPEYTIFDTDIIIHINSVFTILNQLGIGPDEGYVITGANETWDDYVPKESRVRIESLKTFIYIKVKLVFDPPLSSVAVQNLKDTAAEYEWRLTNYERKNSAAQE